MSFTQRTLNGLLNAFASKVILSPKVIFISSPAVKMPSALFGAFVVGVSFF